MTFITRSFIRNYSDRRRVVITGVGVVSSIGISVESAWKFILEGKSATKNLPENEDYSKLPSKV